MRAITYMAGPSADSYKGGLAQGDAYQCKNVALVQENKMIYIGDGK